MNCSGRGPWAGPAVGVAAATLAAPVGVFAACCPAAWTATTISGTMMSHARTCLRIVISFSRRARAPLPFALQHAGNAVVAREVLLRHAHHVLRRHGHA